ncbi:MULTISPECIES: flagellar basal body P-ring protein FlgI [unclassified Novosphingobium]|uniref:flagellar basal body P-ring protein FlgI n=1 Tax=unclassified Novosphingobium TaxID=2644732 RepID=UPI000EB96685|nr:MULTISPECIES: flagellar basal body P-ring protein FlgI [unclassified Novosphingobium]HCF24484.1 flagellar biosynthesis protein FlgI [Novosphingobium sp.]HQV03799.1 flagellar basal body P-ring protein FlgI [Novosphingobium sp.]
MAILSIPQAIVRLLPSRKRVGKLWAAALCALVLATPAQAERIRDLGAFQGVRTNQLTGYGVVVGLSGTGDDSLEYLTQAMHGVSGRVGVQLPPGVNPALKNAAAVMITAELPAFAKPGQRIDVTVSAIGKAKSLRGGSLIMTPLYGADGQVYAIAQGNLAVGGLGVSGADGSKLTVNVPTVGRIADGASVERAVATGYDAGENLRWNLYQSDFLTATRVRDAVNKRWPASATIVDGVTLSLRLPAEPDARASQMAAIEMIEVTPAESSARVVINSRTGTVVINSAVRLYPAAISHGKLTVRVDESPKVVQPAPFSRGETAVQQDSALDIDQQGDRVVHFKPGASLAKLVDALNLLGVSPPDLVAILEALKQAGALKAEMVVI